MRATIPDSDVPGADPDQVVYCFTPWVRKLAFRYSEILKQSGYIDIDDLIQVGCMALLEAQKKYDPERGSFLHFSQFRIRNAMRQEIGFNSHTGELPPILASLDDQAYRDDEKTSLGDTIADPDAEPMDEIADRAMRAKYVRLALDRLKNPNAKPIMESIYFDERTRHETADYRKRFIQTRVRRFLNHKTLASFT